MYANEDILDIFLSLICTSFTDVYIFIKIFLKQFIQIRRKQWCGIDYRLILLQYETASSLWDQKSQELSNTIIKYIES